MPYQGRQPGVGVRDRFIFTATTGQTSFSGNDSNGLPLKYDDAAYVDVFINGTLLVPVTDYTATTKTSVVLIDAAAANDVLEILAYGISSIADTVSASSGGTFAADVTFAGDAIFGDNDKAIFGAGSDLQIYHDGSNSHIVDNGEGNLRMQGVVQVADNPSSNDGRILFGDATNASGIVHYDYSAGDFLFENTWANAGADFVFKTNNVNALTISPTGIGVTGVLYVSDGSVSAPSITNTGDTNTGIFFPAADKIALSAGGTQRLTMAADGKVGLGTDDPTSFNAAASQFVISAGGDTGLTIDATSSTSSSIHFADGPTGTEAYRGYISYSHGNDRMNIGASAVDVLRLQSGNVDIVNGNLIVANGHGIDFSAQTPASGITPSAELLDHYEEGTFTITGSLQGGTVTFNSSYNTMAYTRIGRKVTVTGLIITSAVSSPSGVRVQIGPLPFTTSNLTGGGGAAGGGVSWWDGSNINSRSWLTGEASTTFAIYLDCTDLTAGDDFYISATYFTNA